MSVEVQDPLYFNSHTREGVTFIKPDPYVYKYNFNSHTREGVTFETTLSAHSNIDFNSHTREGVTEPRY